MKIWNREFGVTKYWCGVLCAVLVLEIDLIIDIVTLSYFSVLQKKQFLANQESWQDC